MKKEKTEGTELRSVQVSQDLLRLVITIAILAAAKADDGEEEEAQEGSREFGMFLAAFAVIVALLTLSLQWLWKVGVRLVKESAARSRPELEERKKEMKRRKEGEVAVGVEPEWFSPPPSGRSSPLPAVRLPRGLPPPGFPLLISTMSGRFHADFQCPHRGKSVQYNLCIRCNEGLKTSMKSAKKYR